MWPVTSQPDGQHTPMFIPNKICPAWGVFWTLSLWWITEIRKHHVTKHFTRGIIQRGGRWKGGNCLAGGVKMKLREEKDP